MIKFDSNLFAENLRYLWGHINSYRRKQIFIFFILMVLASFAEVLSIGAVIPFLGALTYPDKLLQSHFLKPLIQFFELKNTSQLVLAFTAIFVLASFISGAMRIFLLWMQARLSHAIGTDLSVSIYRRTLYQPYSIHVARNSSEVISTINNIPSNIVYGILFPILSIFSSLFILLSILAVLLFIEPVVATILFFGLGLIYLTLILGTRKKLVNAGIKVAEEQVKVIKALQEGLGGIRDVLIDSTQELYCGVYNASEIPLRKAQATVQIIAGAPRFLVESIGMALIAVTAYFLATGANGVLAAIPFLSALALGAQRSLPVLQQIYSSWSTLRSSQPGLKISLSYLNQPIPNDLRVDKNAILRFDSTIEIQNISFRYSKNSPWVLQDISLCIQKGERIGIIGETGSGKSTFEDLIMGLLLPSKGQILIDGVEINNHNSALWKKRIAHVPQAIFLADTTIAENIAFGIPLEEIDYERVRHAAKFAQISQTIESWNLGYASVVGERGVRLSGGQRQRIGLARALYKEADVIILDEATSALDGQTESAVMDGLDELGSEVTLLIVAHRISTLSKCSRIVELASGKICSINAYRDIVEH